MKKIKLPEDYTAVLLLLRRTGQVELSNLIESVRYDRSRLLHVIQNLQHKGLILVRRSGYGAWISLSSKGLRVMPLGSPSPA
jgi:uncharacterized membrane protein